MQRAQLLTSVFKVCGLYFLMLQAVLKHKKTRPSLPSRTKPRRSKGKRRKTNEKGAKEGHHGNKTLSLFRSPEEEAARFSRALQEINRRIMGQSMVWLSLSTCSF